jgi:peptide-methionine (S)-S-oxide reductase
MEVPVLFSSHKSRLVSPDEALSGHSMRLYDVPATHAVLGTPLEGPWPEGYEVASFGLGCFWGAERRFWQVPGVYSTAVGYQGGFSPHATYDEVCTGRTGHTEAVQVVYDPAKVSFSDLLKVFWTIHDPTQGFRQANDVGTQYRSAVYWTTDAQREAYETTKAAYQGALTAAGVGAITTEGRAAPEFYYAEDYHQQYLFKVPHGYDCHSTTGVPFPED